MFTGTQFYDTGRFSPQHGAGRTKIPSDIDDTILDVLKVPAPDPSRVIIVWRIGVQHLSIAADPMITRVNGVEIKMGTTCDAPS
jgi:hypothetical protein